MENQAAIKNPKVSLEGFIFDLDGVVTDTQEYHARAWEEMFNELIKERRAFNNPNENLDVFHYSDYTDYLDGKPRKEGIKSFLKSRGIELSEGDKGSEPDLQTINGLAKRKNELYLEMLKKKGPKIFQDTVNFIHRLRIAHIPTALVSSSRNASSILSQTGLDAYFDTVIIPEEAEKKGLRGKPFPDYFLEACHQIKKDPSVCAIVEDSLAGVEAGRAGGFKEVVGIDYRDNEEKLASLKDHGAHEAVTSLWDMKNLHQFLPLPNLIEFFNDVLPLHSRLDYFLFLDFDGTLAPIVDRPSDAKILEGLSQIIQDCTEHFRVCIITGRDTAVIREKLQLSNVVYAACHGFEITSLPDFNYQVEEAKAVKSFLDEAEIKINDEIKNYEGFILERKTFGLAIHYRMVHSKDRVDYLRTFIFELVTKLTGLEVMEGEDVIEILPDVFWDKGMALLKIYEIFGIQQKDLPPIYIGDGQTDENAFREMTNWGIPVLASIEQRKTKAKYHLKGPEEVKVFLNRLLERRSWAVYV